MVFKRINAFAIAIKPSLRKLFFFVKQFKSMQLKVKSLGIQTGNLRVVVLKEEDAFKMGAKPGDRVKIFHVGEDKNYSKGYTGIVDIAISDGVIQKGEIGLFQEVFEGLKLEAGKENIVEVVLGSKPLSFNYIKDKIKGKELSDSQIDSIIENIVEGNHLPIELAALITAIETRGLNTREIVAFTKAMAKTGEILEFGEDVYDKHSTGGVPGNKVTLIIVPIVAAAGLFIPKTSTRAITSPSGTADSMECLAPMAFSYDKLKELLKNRVCIAWGGAINSAPADNILINIEKPLNMDPMGLMIASILCKKMSMGVKKMVLDIPCGPGTKFTTTEEGKKFATLFNEVSAAVGIETICALTSANQPVGHAVGPALEAREALTLLMNYKAGPMSLINKSVELAGILLEMAGKTPKGEGHILAREILKDGRAYKKMREIIQLQGGNPDIKPEDIPIGPYVAEMKAQTDGHVTAVDNASINQIAKIAGAPASKSSGIDIVSKIGAQVAKDQVIFKIYSHSERRLKEAVEYYNAHPPVIMGGMLIEKVERN